MSPKPAVQTPSIEPAEPSPASTRLAHNRALLIDWLAQDQAAQAHPSLGRWASRAVLPLLNDLLRNPLHQPAAALALSALVQAWPRPQAPEKTEPLESKVLGTAVAVVRRHPKTTLTVATVAAAAWWWSHHRPQNTSEN